MFARGSLIVVRCLRRLTDEQRTTNNQLVYDPQQVRDLCHDAAHRRRIGPRHRLVQLRDAEALNDVLLLLRVSDRATIVLDRDASAFIFCLLCHDLSYDSLSRLSK